MTPITSVLLVPLVLAVVWSFYAFFTTQGKAFRSKRKDRLRGLGISPVSDKVKYANLIAVPAVLVIVLAIVIFATEDNPFYSYGEVVTTFLVFFSLGTVILPFLSVVANTTEEKGRSWLAFFWLSALVSPVITGIIAVSLKPLDPPIPPSNTSGSDTEAGLESRLGELHALKEKGLISQEEFEKARKKAIGL